MRLLALRRGRSCPPVDLRAFRSGLQVVLDELLRVPAYDLGVHIITDAAIERLNRRYLRHAGPTDVLAFDYRPHPAAHDLHGELFLGVGEARRQARRYHTTWRSELARYAIHGILHLQGYDDAAPAPRRLMKRREDALLHALARRHPAWFRPARSRSNRPPSVAH
jgi:rRNA maturation RNase YbeY